MSKKRGPISADELMAQLAADPERRAAEAELDRANAERYERIKASEAPLLKDLAKVGVVIDEVFDLVNTSEPYPAALPVLLEHLKSWDYPAVPLEGMARALVTPDSGFAYRDLIELYERHHEFENVRDGLALAIARAASRDDEAEVESLMRDEAMGGSRLFLLGFFERVHQRRDRERLKQVYLESVGDDVLDTEVRYQLKKRFKITA